MKNTLLTLAILICGSCASKKSLTNCESSFRYKYSHLVSGLNPIELLREEKVNRIWINNSSSVQTVMTIIQDTSGNYAELVEMGHKYKRKIFKNEKKIDYYFHREICPINGWHSFLSELNSIEIDNLNSRTINSSDGRIMHHPLTQYLVEIKNGDTVKRLEFFSFYPSQNYPEDMIKFKKLEELILTSFEPLKNKLKHDQVFHKNLAPFEY